ncbi:hypothetical protein BS47DRAFT_1360551 [Hydnum rufescens UP504]|uniref:Uncharacterized protein n=1 Tax=Hydnum rufescens UP504 TaxID=1448309 RepID=A0A9P6DWA5_9AGAM|nr:hypothetical protein BS47DRAFT_1360551 [Hydnum rufescens UP504]
MCSHPDPEPARQPTKYRTTHLPRRVCGNNCTTHPLWRVPSLCDNPPNKHMDKPQYPQPPKPRVPAPTMMINECVYHTPTSVGFFPLPQYMQPPKPPPKTMIDECVYHTPAEVGPFPIPQYAQPPKPPPEMTIDRTAYHTPTLVAPQALSACPLNMTIGKIAYHTPAVVGVWFYIMLATNEDP